MDATATIRSSQPPSSGFVESDKATQDGELYHKRHNSTASIPPVVTTPQLANASPTHHSYPSGPPPPYSHHATPLTTHAPTSHPAVRTSSPQTSSLPANDSRRTSSDEKELAAMTQSSTRQSLPSISEALGVDNQATFHQTLQNAAPVPPSILPLQPPHKVLAEVAAAAAPIMRYPSESKTSQPVSTSTTSNPAAAQASDIARVLYPDSRPALHVQTEKSHYHGATQAGSYNAANANTSPLYERAPTQPPSSAPSSFPYGYTPYPPRYRPSSSAPVASHESGFSSSSKSSTWPSETAAPSRYAVHDRNYGDSVKRHLDLYDLEAALNDIASTSNFLGDFSQRYGNLLHQSPRTGPGLSSLPSIIEVEDMISKSRLQTEALIKIRETVLTQQAAHDQEAAEQREQQKSYGGDMSNHDLDRDGFSSSDLKKRRGRAAPPGRCHSCNRAETPEWRRGPDGARTLCNACGLHYAKLTRKQNNVGKSVAVGSSNLRPKENLL